MCIVEHLMSRIKRPETTAFFAIFRENYGIFKSYLGIKDSKTTEIYTHISQRNIGRIKSLLDFGKKW